jgi:purine-cytosine permease-like protein
MGALLFGYDELSLLTNTAWVMIALSFITFYSLMFQRAPYGRYSSEAAWFYGFKVRPARLPAATALLLSRTMSVQQLIGRVRRRTCPRCR